MIEQGLAERVAAMVAQVNELFAVKSRNSAMRDRFRAVTACAAEAITCDSPIAMSGALKRLFTLAQALREDRYVYRGKPR